MLTKKVRNQDHYQPRKEKLRATLQKPLQWNTVERSLMAQHLQDKLRLQLIAVPEMVLLLLDAITDEAALSSLYHQYHHNDYMY